MPALDPKGGENCIGKPAGYAKKKQDEYTEKDYHKVSDEVKPDWDLRAGGRGCPDRPRCSGIAWREGTASRVEAGQRVPRPARGDAQGGQAMMPRVHSGTDNEARRVR